MRRFFPPVLRAFAYPRLFVAVRHGAGRWFTVLVLLIAMSLKTHQLVTSATDEASVLSSRLFMTGVVQCELLLAFWLASGVLARIARIVALQTFAIFGVATFWALVSGSRSCGCFGRAEIDPAFTLVLDVFVFYALYAWRPNQARRLSPVCRAVIAAVIWAPISLAIGKATALYHAGSIMPDGQLVAGSRVVEIEPLDWVGENFPIYRYVEIDADIRSGEWLIVFHRHDCSRCSEVVPFYIERARSREMGAVRTALIEVPPLSSPGVLTHATESAFSSGKLNDRITWFMRTPAVVRLSNSRVLTVGDPQMAFQRTSENGND